MSLKVYLSETHNPWFNLATENWLFQNASPRDEILYLWRNEDTVVIGRYQNPWVECNLQKMEEDNVKLARRQSGGGSVFHDLGNLNFTFINGKEHYDKDRNVRIIQAALGRFGITAAASGRNDILVEDRKVSGSAYKETREICFHHGTLLVNANLGRLGEYLNPERKKLESKGISSVKSRVANLAEFNSELTCVKLQDAIIDSFFAEYKGNCTIETLSSRTLEQIPELLKYYDSIRDWNWRFGKTPEFSHHLEQRFPWGNLDVHLDCHNGRICEATIFSDCLQPELVEVLINRLKKCEYDGKCVKAALDDMANKNPALGSQLQEAAAWLASEMGTVG